MRNLLVLLSSAGLCEEPTFHWEPSVDVPITLAAGTTFALLYLGVEDDRQPGGQVSQPTGIDAWVRPGLNSTWKTTSDGLMYGSIGAGLGLVALDGALDGEGAHTRVWIATEAFMVNQVATSTLKMAVGRPRPYTQLSPDDPEVAALIAEADSEMSFPSGHTSTVAVMAFDVARTWQLSGATRGQSVLAYGLAGAATGLTGASRVLAGKHHPTDVIAGAVLGGSIGSLVPTLHVSERPLSLAAGPRSLVVSTRF